MELENRKVTKEERERAETHILENIAEERSLRAILREDGNILRLPLRVIFYDWLRDSDALANQYGLFREIQADNLYEEILDISNKAEKDTYIADEGISVANHENIQRSRLKIDARKWVLSKMIPKKFGDRIDQNVDVTSKGDKITNTIEVEIIQAKDDE